VATVERRHSPPVTPTPARALGSQVRWGRAFVARAQLEGGGAEVGSRPTYFEICLARWLILGFKPLLVCVDVTITRKTRAPTASWVLQTTSVQSDADSDCALCAAQPPVVRWPRPRQRSRQVMV